MVARVRNSPDLESERIRKNFRKNLSATSTVFAVSTTSTTPPPLLQNSNTPRPLLLLLYQPICYQLPKKPKKYSPPKKHPSQPYHKKTHFPPEQNKVWSRLSAHFQRFFSPLLARILIIFDETYRILTCRNKRGSCLIVLQQNKKQAYLPFTVAAYELSLTHSRSPCFFLVVSSSLWFPLALNGSFWL